jgi:MFS family permease
MIVIGLGTIWILDGLEVTIVGNISGQLGKPGSGIHITQAQVSGLGAARYVLDAYVGALFLGWLTDRFGREKLFMITLAVYLAGHPGGAAQPGGHRAAAHRRGRRRAQPGPGPRTAR